MFFTTAEPNSATDLNGGSIWGGESTWSSPNITLSDKASVWAYNSSVSSEETPGAPICKFFVSGSCSAGRWCRFSHHLPPDELQDMRTCEICSEDVLLKGFRFGLLENCHHVFCLPCIREWRNQKEKQDRLNLRKCPICRVDSFVIIPALHYMTGEEKAREKTKYVEHLSMIPCKNFGKGQCPFGSSCLYLHAGSATADENSFVILKGADGTRTKKHSQLSDFLRY